MSIGFDRLKTLAGQKGRMGTTKEGVRFESLKSISHKFRKLIISCVDKNVNWTTTSTALTIFMSRCICKRNECVCPQE